MIEQIKVIANNALYFQDSSDYETALWQILGITSPELFDDDGFLDTELEYIEE